MTLRSKAYYDYFASEESGGESWMLTLADLLSLLLVFFIMINATTIVKEDKFDKITESLGDAFKSDRATKTDGDLAIGIKKQTSIIGTNLEYLYAIISERVSKDEFLSKNVRIEQMDDRVVISMSSNAMFDKSIDILNENSKEILLVIGSSIQNISNKIEVIGSYENQGILEVNPWELALRRSAKIAEDLQKFGYTAKIDIRARKSHEDSDNSNKFVESIDIVIRKEFASDFEQLPTE